MEESIREFSGRAFSTEEIELIQWTVKTYPQLSRNEIANTICEFLGWKQINGRPKTKQSISLLKKLEEEGQIQLQAKTKKIETMEKTREKGTKDQSDVLLRETTSCPARSAEEDHIIDENTKSNEWITKSGKIELALAESAAEKKLWRTYVGKYHKLGCKIVFGAQLRYFIRSGGSDLGCLQFSASAWSLSPRDKWIGWTMQERKARLHLIVNNSRFLVLPWVQARNIPSRALSAAARQIEVDWLREYNYAPVLLETFVDTTYYQGTSYKAANWIYLGQTQGRGRNDRRNERALTEKAIYVYPLHRSFREILKGDKPCKAVCPDE